MTHAPPPIIGPHPHDTTADTDKTLGFVNGVSVNSVHSVDSVDSVHSVLSVTDLDAAIARSLAFPLGGPNNARFRYGRMLAAMLPLNTSSEILDDAAQRWYSAAVEHCRNNDIEADLSYTEVIGDIVHAFTTCTTPDDGNNFVTTAWADLGEVTPPPSWIRCETKPQWVRLAQLVTALDRTTDGGTWKLGTSDATMIAFEYPNKDALSPSHRSATNRTLNSWHKRKIVEIVERAKPGPPGSPAHRFRLLKRQESTPDPVPCKHCSKPMIPAMEIKGWRNWDCPGCKHIQPMRTTQ